MQAHAPLTMTSARPPSEGFRFISLSARRVDAESDIVSLWAPAGFRGGAARLDIFSTAALFCCRTFVAPQCRRRHIYLYIYLYADDFVRLTARILISRSDDATAHYHISAWCVRVCAVDVAHKYRFRHAMPRLEMMPSICN